MKNYNPLDFSDKIDDMHDSILFYKRRILSILPELTEKQKNDIHSIIREAIVSGYGTASTLLFNSSSKLANPLIDKQFKNYNDETEIKH